MNNDQKTRGDEALDILRDWQAAEAVYDIADTDYRNLSTNYAIERRQLAKVRLDDVKRRRDELLEQGE